MVPGHKLPKLAADGISPTLRAGTDSTRGSHTAPRPIHPLRPRVITAREAARLHGYPDWFSFFPVKWHAYRQIGNSVCPPVARAIGAEIIRAMGIDPGSLPRPICRLEDSFDLPEDRIRTERRISTADEFPKVIDYLWERSKAAGANPSSLLLDSELIAEAISATRAKLPRVPPVQFLGLAMRYRNPRLLMATPLQEGYTIEIVDRELGSGRFVSVES
jgi:hypothetical protein